jgi:hypothetical protein
VVRKKAEVRAKEQRKGAALQKMFRKVRREEQGRVLSISEGELHGPI